MEVIPVIDIKDGIAVHARRGKRADYAPLRSDLVEGCFVPDVVRALVSNFSPDKLYIADLNAIEGDASNSEILAGLCTSFPQLHFWIDRGLAPLTVPVSAPSARIVTVYGSESLTDMQALQSLDAATLGAGVLSLDFKDGKLLGPESLLEHPELWPPHVIALDLARVGAGTGPDIAQLRGLQARAPDKRIYAGGGVRSIEDLQRLSEMGLCGALVATALHSGAITARDLAQL